MLKAGLATVYESKQGVEFSSKKHEKRYRRAEAKAKAKRKGIWNASKIPFESPRQFKARMGLEDQEKNG